MGQERRDVSDTVRRSHRSPCRFRPAHTISVVDDVHDALDRFDRAFTSSDADALTDVFAVDGTMLQPYREPLKGREAIHDHTARTFAEYDPSAWRTEPVLIDVHDDRAYVLSTYSETLVHRGGGESIDIRGRLVLFLRRDADGVWRVTLAMNQHSRPVARVPATGA